MIELLFLLLGIIALLLSGEVVIRSAQRIATHFNISDSFVGLTILSIGTSLAEIGAHIASSYEIIKGGERDLLSGIAVGTNIGSNIVQITAILGIVALALRLKATKKFMRQDYFVMLGSIVLVFLLGLDGSLNRIEGVALALLYLGYIYHLARAEDIIGKVDHNHNQDGVLKGVVFLLIGLSALVGSADFVVSQAQQLAQIWNVKGALIGALIIGLGTALPELTTAIIAIRRRSKDMGLGVLVGSNITNPLFALGIGAAITPYTMNEDILFFQLPFWFIVSLILYYFFMKGKDINRIEALTLIGLYVTYIFLSLSIFL